VDNNANNPGMTIDETCDKGVQEWVGMLYNDFTSPVTEGDGSGGAYVGKIANWATKNTVNKNGDWLVGCDEKCQIIDKKNS
jgi:hypothetical protein